MPRAERAEHRFVRALLRGAVGTIAEEHVVAGEMDRRSTVRLAVAERLASEGVLATRAGTYVVTDTAAAWLKRQLLEDDAFAGQHRDEIATPTARLNLAESPLLRLAVGRPGEPAFLERHQVEAGERVRKLAARAQLMPKMTMSYSQAHTASPGAGQGADIPDMAVDARRKLRDLHRQLPRDCAEVVLDVCGLGKGLQVVEQERGWPRRSAKLVLRIGLEQLAACWGLASAATGAESRRPQWWLEDGARPTGFR